MFRQFVKDSLVYSLPTFVSRGLSFVLIPLYTRVLSPADYGALDIFLVFVNIVSLTLTLEISQGLARLYTTERSQENKVKYFCTALWFSVICYTVFCAIALYFSGPLAFGIMGQEQFGKSFEIGVVYIWTSGIFFLLLNQLRWRLESLAYAAASLSMSLITAFSSVFLAYFLNFGLEGLMMGMAMGVLGGSVYCLWKLKDELALTFSFPFLKLMLSFSAPLVFAGGISWASLYCDRMMIKQFLTLDDLGIYGIGFRIASLSTLILIGAQSAFSPLVYSRIEDKNTPYEIARIFRIYAAFSISICVGIILFSDLIVRVIATEPFYGGAHLSIYLVPSLLLSSGYVFAPGISIKKKTHYFIWINLSGLIANILIGLFLIPRLGLEGAAIASLCSSFLMFSLFMFASHRLYPVPHNWRKLFLVALISVILVILVLKFKASLIGMAIISSLALSFFIVVLLMLEMVTLNEINESIDRLR